MSSRAHRATWSSGSGSNAVSVVVGGVLPRNLARIFARQNGAVKLLGVRTGSVALLRVIESQSPDVLLLAGPLTQFGLVNLLRQIHAHSTINILILTNRRDPHFIGTILRWGVKGCLRTRPVGDDVAKAILAVKRGEVWLERKLVSEALRALIAELHPSHWSGAPRPQADVRNPLLLTNRESEIVAILGQGLTNKEIAKALNVSTETVKKHLKNIFAKLGVHRRTQVFRTQPSLG
jgi:DNA-binding NarL/FixJ family response regulator